MKYYEGSKPLNSDCPIIFSNGNRSTGKSFNWKRYVIRRFLKNKEEFIYIRRTQKDFDRCLDTWFDDVSCKFDNNLLVETSKNVFNLLTCDDEGNVIKREKMGYYFSLSETIKSIPFQNVKTILFDEYLPDDGRYLHSSNPYWEPEQILNIYMTVARGINQPIRDDVKMICIANNISIFNPYFSYFGIDMSGYDGQSYYSVVNDGVYAEITYNQEVAETLKKSKLGGVLSRTHYGQHATENKSLLDTKFNIVPVPENLHYEFSLYTAFGWLSCWSDGNGNIFFREGADKQFPKKFKTQPIPDYPFPVPYLQGVVFNNLRKIFMNDRMYYETGKAKAAVGGLFMSGKPNLNYN